MREYLKKLLDGEVVDPSEIPFHGSNRSRTIRAWAKDLGFACKIDSFKYNNVSKFLIFPLNFEIGKYMYHKFKELEWLKDQIATFKDDNQSIALSSTLSKSSESSGRPQLRRPEEQYAVNYSTKLNSTLVGSYGINVNYRHESGAEDWVGLLSGAHRILECNVALF